MSEETLLYDPEEPWVSYAHFIVYILWIAISIPCCDMTYKLSAGVSGCPFARFTSYLPNLSSNTNLEVSAPIERTASGDRDRDPSPYLDPQNPQTHKPAASASSYRSTSQSPSPNQPRAQTKNQLSDHMTWHLKLTLFLSIFLAYLYVLLQAFFSTFRIGLSGLSVLICRGLGGPVLSYLFICGRLFLYLFFLLRAYVIFQGSFFQHKQSRLICIFIATFIASQVIGIPMFVLNEERDLKVLTNQVGGDICWFFITDIDHSHHINLWFTIVHAYGYLLDNIFAILSIYMITKPLCVCIRQSKNNKGNEMVVLVSRLWIVLVIAVVSSQLTLVLYLLLPVDFSAIIFPFDNVVNMYCLWLTFTQNEKWYFKYFCGKRCMKTMFPFVKSMALTNHTFCCCCCTYCWVCDAEKKAKQKELRQTARQ
eukprot:974776_1